MIIEILLSLFLAYLAWHVTTTYMKRKNMPPGPFPYPFIGNIPQIISADPVKSFDKLTKKYGDIFTVTFPFGLNVVIVSTASLAREARLAEKRDDMAGRAAWTIFPLQAILASDIFACDHQTVYDFRRKVFISALHIFGSGKDRFSARASHACKIAIDEIENKPGRIFSPRSLFESAIIVQLWEWLTSKMIALDDPVVNKVKEFSILITKQSGFNLHPFLPFLSYLPTQTSRDIKRAQEIWNEMLVPEYQAHNDSHVQGVIRDLTDSFISAYEKEIAKEKVKNIGSKDDIPGLMLDVLFAGSETTSASLSWFFLFMVLYPNVQTKIHQELDAAVSENEGLLSWKDVQKFPYLHAALCETQRASGVIQAVVTTAIRDTGFAGYRIPKGTALVLNLSRLHHDEREWPEPEKFKPERFLDSDNKFIGWNKLHAFLPFSYGRRECLGQTSAIIMMFTFTSVLLQRFKFEIPEGAKLPAHDKSDPSLVARPMEFQVVATPRKSEFLVH